MMRILVLGASGMLGNAMFRVLSEHSGCEVFGTIRGAEARRHFCDAAVHRLITGVEVENHDSLVRAFATVRPTVVVNCIGLVKQLASVNDPLQVVPINTLLPHRLAALCKVTAARLVHFSTDCVFSGAKGGYLETDFPDADDLYGRTKLLGEVDYPNAITLRTSMIGHELTGSRSLIGWFLAQQSSVKGFTRVIFSGLPTVELSRVVRDFVLPRPDLRGIYHVAAKPISKCELLRLVAEIYGKTIEIVPDDQLVIDRSLNADRFRETTSYVAPAWPELVKRMYEFK
jgi:dTDP-4-dehydrorhamnose reductase